MQMSINCVSSSIQLMRKMGLEDANHIFYEFHPTFFSTGWHQKLAWRDLGPSKNFSENIKQP